ncbi:MAG: hypothetical protein ACJ74W_04835 [Pyrinomonadaceae bacterium]
MKQKVTSLLIIIALLAAPLTAIAAGRPTQTVAETKARAAEAQAKAKEVVVKVRAGTKILVGKKEFPFEFLKSASLSGRVTELREQDFTFAQTGDHNSEVITAISYADVLSIKHESGFRKALKNVGKYSLGGVEIPVFLPLFGVLALLGRLPDC